MSTGDRRALAYQPALDGLRGLAVLAVLAFHAGFPWARGGWLGVSTFFTLSGFLITAILLHGARHQVPLRRFWARRARRLLPASWLALAGAAVFGATVADATQLARLRGDVLAALAYVGNWRFVASEASYAELFRSPSPVLHVWSLAIEEQFYLLFPALLVGLAAVLHQRRAGDPTPGRHHRPPPRRDRLAVALGVLALLSTAWLTLLAARGVAFDRLYYGTDTRMAELATGAALGALVGHRPALARPRLRNLAGWVGLAALVGLVAAYATVGLGERWLFSGGLQVVALAGAAVVLAACQPGSPVQRLLAVEPLRRLGLVSYGTYLFHWPVFLWLQASGWSPWAVFAGGGALTLALAAASYRWLEQPIRTGRWLRDRRAQVAAPAAGLVVLAGLTVVATHDPPPDPVALLAEAEAQAGAPATPPPPPTTNGEASPGDTAPPPPARVMVVGDSVSWFLGDGLERWADGRDDVVVWNRGTFGCGIARGGEILLSTGPTPPEARCDDWRQRWSAPLADFDPAVVVVLTGLWDLADRRLPGGAGTVHVGTPEGDRFLVDQFAEAVDVLSSRGARVVWLTTPCSSEVIFPGPLAETDALLPERQRHLNQAVLPALVETRPEVEVLDLDAVACPDGAFTPDLLADRFDGVHFTEEAALEVAGWLGPAVLEVVPGGSSPGTTAPPRRIR